MKLKMKLKLYAIGIWYFIATHITELVLILGTILCMICVVAWAITGLEVFEIISSISLLALIVATVKLVLSREAEEE